MWLYILYFIIGALFLPLVIAAVFIKYYTKWNKSYTCLLGKTVIVTGANTGIGYYAALDFAKRGARVILACRNQDKADAARDKIIAETDNPKVIVKLINFTSLQSVRDFAKDFNATEDRLDILVNNAGAAGLGNHFTEDNLQITWQINHYSAFLLTHLVIDKLKKCAPSRIVNLSSIAAKSGIIDIETINEYPNVGSVVKSDFKLYAMTKLANVLFTRELALRVSDSNIIVNAVHPGGVATDIWRRLPKTFLPIIMFVLNLILKTSEEGAQTTLHTALSKDVANITGKYFSECAEQPFAENFKDMNLSKKLWEKSEEMVKLNANEKISA